MWVVNKDITAIIVSDNSWDSFKNCLYSFSRLTNDLPHKFIVIENSKSKVMRNNIINEFGDRFNVICNSEKLDYDICISDAISKVKTKYTLILDENYEFNNNKSFIQDALVLLNKNKINQVIVRSLSNIKKSKTVFSEELLHEDNIKYKLANKGVMLKTYPSLWITSLFDSNKPPAILMDGACTTNVSGL